MVKLSVIINVKEFSDSLENCVKSVCSYMGKDLEIVVLTNNLTDKLQDSDKRIKFIDSNCENLSKEILSSVTGKYVTLLDPCDCFYREGLSKIMSAIRQLESDIIMLSYNVETQDGQLKRIKPLFEDMTEFSGVENDHLIRKLIIRNNFNIFKSVLLRTNFVKDKGIKLDSLSDNFESGLVLFDEAESIVAKDIKLFVFKTSQKNVSSEFEFNSFEIFKDNCKIQSKYLEKWNASDDIASEVHTYKFMVLSQMFHKAFEQSSISNETNKKLKEILKSDWVKEIVHKVDDKKLSAEYKKSLTAFKLGNVKMVRIVNKFKK